MTLSAGTTFGTYEILAPLGAGGMGEVYRGRDSRLQREVAIKVLPADVAGDPERRSRLTREARLLAALSHPNIAAIYGVEEKGEGIALVLELVEGATLAERLASGPVPLKTTVAIAWQVAQAVEAAHARGIIHRDLKPANIKVTPDGRVKVLDFGVAKALIDDAPGAPGSLTPQSMATHSGVVVGTPGYMSPEQSTGSTVDRRADNWAFGCVLFELLSGRRPFAGATISETLVRVLEHEPDWSALPRETPERLIQLLERCLRKEPDRRLQDIGDARVELEDLVSGTAHSAPSSRVRGRARGRQIPLWVGIAGVVFVGSIAALVAPRRAGDAASLRLAVLLPAGVTLPMETGHPVLALSPDGSTLVFVGVDRGVQRLYKRVLAEPNASPLPGTEGASAPFFSPDGAWIGFVDENFVKRVALAGGVPVTVAEATQSSVNQGLTWVARDTILIALSPNSGLSVQPVVDGRVGRISDWRVLSRDSASPYAMPHAVHRTARVVFVDNVGDTPDKARVSVMDRRSGDIRTLVTGGTHPLFSPPDHLLFTRGGALYAVEADLRAGRIGAESRVLDSVIAEPGGAAHVTVSGTGTIAYLAGPPVKADNELGWVDLRGAFTPILAGGRDWRWPRLSRDGARIAATASVGANADVYTFAVNRLALERVTTDAGEDFGAIWSPDGNRLAFASEQFSANKGPRSVWQRAKDGKLESVQPGTAADTSSGARADWDFPTSWSPDGKWLAYSVWRDGEADVEVVGTDGRSATLPIAAARNVREVGAAFAPDSRAIAYVSDETGEAEVYVQTFPAPGRKVRISVDGGAEPLWNRVGLELFYRRGDDLMSVRFDNQSALEPRKPVVLFTGHFDPAPFGGQQANYDISPDGSRFLFVRRANLPKPTAIHLITNWTRAFGVRP